MRATARRKNSGMLAGIAMAAVRLISTWPSLPQAPAVSGRQKHRTSVNAHRRDSSLMGIRKDSETTMRRRAEQEYRRPSASFDGRVVLRKSGADVVGTRPDKPIIVQLLDDVRRPSADARYRKDGREQVPIDAQRGGR